MQLAWIGLVLFATGPIAAADVVPKSTWVAFDHKPLGVHLLLPPSAKVTVKGAAVTVTGKDLPAITIVTSQTTGRLAEKNGGVKGLQVSWTISSPRRSATCSSIAADPEQATIASQICETLDIAPAPRTPHTEITVTTTDLADPVSFDKATHAKQRQLDACWRTALAKDKDMPEGEIEVRRSYESDQPASTSENHRNFFDHDAKPLGACVAALIKAVPARTVGVTAEIKVNVICQLY
jgi:hypothetical protein